MKKIYFICFFILIGSLISVRNLYSDEIQSKKFYEEARKYEGEGNLEKAIEFYQKAFENSQNISFKKTILELLGQVYRAMKRYEDALQIYQKYLELASTPFEEVRGKTAIAYIYVYKGKYSKGLQILEKIIEEYHDPQFRADAIYSKAAIYHRFIKDYEKAINEYERLIKEFPDDWRVKEEPICLEKIAVCYSKLKKYDDAIKVYQDIINKYPESEYSKIAKVAIRIINEYEKKGKVPSEDDVKKIEEEMGIKYEE
jgi:tetratricopeptide (TPR) repeat protein